MTQFEASLFDGVYSKPWPVSVEVDLLEIIIRGEFGEHRFPLGEVKVRAPLGSAPRQIDLPGGALLETSDHEAVRALEKREVKKAGIQILVQLMERHWGVALAGSAILAAFLFLFFQYGLPALAHSAAAGTPLSVREALTDSTMESMDGFYMEPSELPEERIAELEERFDQLVAALPGLGNFNYRIEFRDFGYGDYSANAFALPDGLIVMTDGLVELAKDDIELVAVWAHEIAHVEKHHGLRSVYQGAGLAFIATLVLGDISSVSGIAGSLPIILLESQYSQRFEKEADVYAGEYLLASGDYSTAPMRDVLLRMTRGDFEMPLEQWLSTHPKTKERVTYLEELDGQFYPDGLPESIDTYKETWNDETGEEEKLAEEDEPTESIEVGENAEAE